MYRPTLILYAYPRTFFNFNGFHRPTYVILKILTITEIALNVIVIAMVTLTASPMYSSILFYDLSTVGCCLICNPVDAVYKRWIKNTDFDNPSNWNTGNLPCPKDRIIFPAISPVVSINQDWTINHLVSELHHFLTIHMLKINCIYFIINRMCSPIGLLPDSFKAYEGTFKN